MNPHKIICFGEVLWDLLPSGKIAGGAPMNVAYHLNNFGFSTSMISRIGRDALGKELIRFLQDKGIDTALIQDDAFYPTGTVHVHLDKNGSPSYHINQPVAWDFINLDKENIPAVKSADALVFGSLALRKNRTKETLLALLDNAKLKVFDVNLRVPFYTKETLEILLSKADIVKMNDEELELIGRWNFAETREITLAQKVKALYQIDILIITQGSRGAFVIDGDNDFRAAVAKKVQVQDTIGSGDSFLAGFLAQYLEGEPLMVCLDFASRTGALVATKKGGTPKITEEMVVSLS